jgi:ADP-ribosylglycohydrolase
MSISSQLWLRYAPDLQIELEQCRDEGKDLSGLAGRIAAVQALPLTDPRRESRAASLLDETINLPVSPGFSYSEPSDLSGIHALRPPGPRRLPYTPKGDELYDRLYGAWLGRCAGCLLGIPVEGWSRQRILAFTQATGNYPITRYLSSDHPPEIVAQFNLQNESHFYGGLIPWVNNIDCAPMDDDTNYTIIALLVLETYGPEFTSEQVGLTWLRDLPLLQTCTAERIAYRNLANLVLPPDSAAFRNPFREWIGAQIRADCYGYVNPGWIERAAAMAWRDARVSHVKNGLYGAIWVAAMLSAAFTTTDLNAIIQLGLTEIPASSRLTAAIQEVLSWQAQTLTWEQALERLHQQWDETNPYHWTHTIPNAMIVAIALLYGQADLQHTISIAASAGFDTDCNAATAGSIVGLLRGAAALGNQAPQWITPLRDHLRSSVRDHPKVPISILAKRTAHLAHQSLQL